MFNQEEMAAVEGPATFALSDDEQDAVEALGFDPAERRGDGPVSGYRLVRDGIPKIMQGRKWVGRVYHSKLDGLWHGKIGNHEASASSEVGAFEAVAALALGYPSASALRASNAEVRQANRARRQRAQYAVGEAYRGNWKPFDDILSGRLK